MAEPRVAELVLPERIRAAAPRAVAAVPAPPVLSVHALTVTAGRRTLLAGIDLTVERGGVLALVGPSGVGKSTLLRSLNRLLDLVPGLAVRGQVRLDGESIYARGVDVDALRARVGMLFQQPVVFPGSIEDNVLFGVRRVRRVPRRERPALVERALREAALWPQVADRLAAPAHELSVGQQQRLCLARTLAVEPEVVLMDEPTSALDAESTRAIEERILALKHRRTVVLVTHDLEQAWRVADEIVRLETRDGAGRVAETFQPTSEEHRAR